MVFLLISTDDQPNLAFLLAADGIPRFELLPMLVGEISLYHSHAHLHRIIILIHFHRWHHQIITYSCPIGFSHHCSLRTSRHVILACEFGISV